LQGTGLGLNIVKKYLELIQGEIEVKSVENEGSTFKITFTNKLKINKPLNHEENLIN
jgi:signal transduction histidine kinase